MPNIASILKTEISRVARKEVRTEIETLKKASTHHRASIAALRRQVEKLERELRRALKMSSSAAPAGDSDDGADSGPSRRFSATRLASHREKLGLSAAAYGKLVGVTSGNKARRAPARHSWRASRRCGAWAGAKWRNS
jgi:chromosome segregation ATPase